MPIVRGALIMQREDLHRSSTTVMPIVVIKCPNGNPNKQTILNTIYSKNDDFFLEFFSDLKLGFFHPNIEEK